MEFKNIDNILKEIKRKFGNSEDLISKEFFVCNKRAILIYLNGITDTEKINQFILLASKQNKETKKDLTIDYITKNIFNLSEQEEVSDIKVMVDNIAKGKTIVLVEEQSSGISIDTFKIKERSISEPPTSSVMKGPRSGFVENIKTNLSSIKKILATNELRCENLVVGKYTKTSVAIVYINGVADKKVVKRIKTKIKAINIDGIIDSFYIASYLELKKSSMFKQVGSTEKPDIACAKALEGRVLILVDGSPIVLTLPFILWEDLQSSDDYYGQHANAFFVRVIRFCSLFITMLLPAMYIAVELHHYKSVPLTFLVTIINTTQDLPLTPFAEILFVLTLFEILYETSLRMPKYLGLALSVVGALILGDTAVKAGLISPPAVMFVAVSSITEFTTPDQAPQLSMLRFAFALAGGFLGFYGIVLFFLFLVFYLSDFDAYGSAYLAPLSPFHKRDFQDMIYKTDITKMKYRPTSIPNVNKRRSG